MSDTNCVDTTYQNASLMKGLIFPSTCLKTFSLSLFPAANSKNWLSSLTQCSDCHSKQPPGWNDVWDVSVSDLHPGNLQCGWCRDVDESELLWLFSCSTVGRAGRLVIGRSLVQIPALGWAELHVKVSLSKILNPKLLLMCGWHLARWPLPSLRAQRQLGLAPAKTLTTP